MMISFIMSVFILVLKLFPICISDKNISQKKKTMLAEMTVFKLKASLYDMMGT